MRSRLPSRPSQQVIEFIYQLTGISDIVRGQTDPNETLGAQQLKGQFASLRLRDMQAGVAQYATEVLQLKGQIMCLKFSPETLLQISAADQLSEADKQYVPKAMQLLLGERAMNPDAESKNPLRSFRIEVNADTLVQFDENSEKENASEFLTGSWRVHEAGGRGWGRCSYPYPAPHGIAEVGREPLQGWQGD
jgi:hypothetical protein